MPTDRFAVLTDAAIDVLADLGMRGLTHRAVDARAELPLGTTSAYFRTRKALIEAVVRRLADLDRADLDRADLEADRLPSGAVPLPAAEPSARAENPSPSGAGDPVVRLDDLDAAAAGIAALLDRWMSTGRSRTLARYACLLEATHHPELRTILAYGDASRSQATAMLAAAGVEEPERAGGRLVACIDGLLFDRLAGAGSRDAPAPGTAANRTDLTAAVATLLRAFTKAA
ncbi:TetR/AcrR family transcriptional regulator [Actinoplanes sp. NPDC051633]|uniref:TetR/AcrR family transcriptional regulator n=1 Tax=Actinoplanes sp. NPDC051633 TaxID=3155670 RepID=UPI003438D3F6